MKTEAKKSYPIYQPPFIGSTPFHVSCQKMRNGFGAHWHGELEIIYVMPESECIVVTVDGTEYALSPRDAVFISGTEVHSVNVVGSEADVLVIEIGFSLLGHDFSVFTGQKFVNSVVGFSSLQSENDKKLLEIERIFTEIICECSHLEGTPSEWKPVNRLHIASLLFKLAAVMAEHLPMTPVSAQRIKQLEAVMAVQSVLMYVEQAYPEQITLEHAAGIAGYEKTRFCQLFKQAVGISFHKYLNDRRLRAAELLLKGTNLPISQIAQTVGIFQPKTFSRLIRESYGITPSELRSQRNKE